MSTTNDQSKYYARKKRMYYILAFVASYVFPFLYFYIKSGLTQTVEKTVWVLPTTLVLALGAIKVSADIPSWVQTWQPSFAKGMIRAIPTLLTFIVLVTLGLSLKYVLERQIALAFTAYFETVFVLFGGMSVGSIFGAFHLKYKELFLISKGYVLGVVNK